MKKNKNQNDLLFLNKKKNKLIIIHQVIVCKTTS